MPSAICSPYWCLAGSEVWRKSFWRVPGLSHRAMPSADAAIPTANNPTMGKRNSAPSATGSTSGTGGGSVLGHEDVGNRKSLLALRGVGPESEAESVRFHGRRVTKVGPEVKQLPPEGWGPLNKGCERRTRALPDVSGGGERHDRFGVVVGEGVVEPRIEGRFGPDHAIGALRRSPWIGSLHRLAGKVARTGLRRCIGDKGGIQVAKSYVSGGR